MGQSRMVAVATGLACILGIGLIDNGRAVGQQPVVKEARATVLDTAPDDSESDAPAWPIGYEAAVEYERDAAPAACACGSGDCCGCEKQAALAKAVKEAHKLVFYDNDFSYLCDPCYDGWHLGDNWKRLAVGDHVTLDFGGQYRARFHHETNMRGLGLTGRDDRFLLHQTRVYANAEVGSRFRAYAEYIDAESNYENFAPRAIEVNRSDMLNLFGDYQVFEGDTGQLWGRVGRQELNYGSQRLISTLPLWANARRTFDGAKLFWKGQDWNIDAFWTQPVGVDPHNFDSPIRDQELMGVFGTYKGFEKETVDVYYLRFYDKLAPNSREIETIGGRWKGEQDDWLWETEGGVQFGLNTDGSDRSAGFATVGLGRRASACHWKPTLWCYYDWASGTDDRGAGNGMHHLLPLGHRYLGFMDIYGRSNIETPNVLLTLQPTDRLQLLVWYYYFFLENKNDTPYSVTMAPFHSAVAPADADLGQEIDLLATYQLTPRSDLEFCYSHFFAGDYYALTPGVPYTGNANFFYTQWTLKF